MQDAKLLIWDTIEPRSIVIPRRRDSRTYWGQITRNLNPWYAPHFGSFLLRFPNSQILRYARHGSYVVLFSYRNIPFGESYRDRIWRVKNRTSSYYKLSSQIKNPSDKWDTVFHSGIKPSCGWNKSLQCHQSPIFWDDMFLIIPFVVCIVIRPLSLLTVNQSACALQPRCNFLYPHALRNISVSRTHPHSVHLLLSAPPCHIGSIVRSWHGAAG